MLRLSAFRRCRLRWRLRWTAVQPDYWLESILKCSTPWRHIRQSSLSALCRYSASSFPSLLHLSSISFPVLFHLSLPTAAETEHLVRVNLTRIIVDFDFCHIAIRRARLRGAIVQSDFQSLPLQARENSLDVIVRCVSFGSIGLHHADN